MTENSTKFKSELKSAEVKIILKIIFKNLDLFRMSFLKSQLNATRRKKTLEF